MGGVPGGGPPWQLRDGLLALRYPDRAALWDLATQVEIPLSLATFTALATCICGAPDPLPEGLPPAVPALLRPVPNAAAWPDPLLLTRLEALEEPGGTAGPDAAAAHAAIRRGHAARKVFHFDHFQMPAQPESGGRRVALLAGLAAAAGARARAARMPVRVLLLGDDDLLSLGLVALGIPVAVADIDTDLLAWLKLQAPAIETHAADLTGSGLPASLRGRFAVVFGDPMSSYPGVRSFLAAALTALAPGGRVVICGHPRLAIVFNHLQHQHGLVLHAHHPAFNAYYNPKTITPLADRKDLYVLGRP